MSRKIFLDDACTLHFTGRGAEFSDGVEVGILAAQMDRGIINLQRWIAVDNLEQIRALAVKLGYRLLPGEIAGDTIHITLLHQSARPRLRLMGKV